MKTNDAVAFFGSKAEVARKAGVSRSRVSQWGDNVPELQSYRLERASNGRLKADIPTVSEQKDTQAND